MQNLLTLDEYIASLLKLREVHGGDIPVAENDSEYGPILRRKTESSLPAYDTDSVYEGQGNYPKIPHILL